MFPLSLTMFTMIILCLTLFCNVFSTCLSMITMFHHAFGQVFTMGFSPFLFDTFQKNTMGVSPFFFYIFPTMAMGFFTVSPSEAHGFFASPGPRWSAVPPCARWPSLRATAARGADRPPPRGCHGAMEGGPMVMTNSLLWKMTIEISGFSL